MHGGNGHKNASEASNTFSGELDEEELATWLRRFVEDSELSIPKIASMMGVFSVTLSMWIAGTTKPGRVELLEIRSFLAQHGSKAGSARTAD
jgi:DNA transposition AAA+ family ATPase